MLYSILKKKIKTRLKRKKKIRNNISGTKDIPRISIFKSNRYLYIQAIDDVNGHTLASIHGKKLNLKVNKNDAKIIAQKFADDLKTKKITKVVFDRNGYLYHGVVKVFADSLRESNIIL